MGRSKIVGTQVAETIADGVGHRERIEEWVVRKQATVVAGDVKPGIAAAMCRARRNNELSSPPMNFLFAHG
jgi:hypothetical protein